MSAMGSCTSNMRPSVSQENNINVNGARLSETGASLSGAAESEKSPAPKNRTADEKAKVENTIQEKPGDAKLVQSFGWLVQTPVVLHTTPKYPKDKAKKTTEEDQKNKSGNSNIYTYSKGKYLKSAEPATSASNTKPKQRSHAGSSSALVHAKCGENVGSGCQADKLAKTKISGQKDNEHAAASPRFSKAYPVGFGVIGEKIEKDSELANRGSSGVKFHGDLAANRAYSVGFGVIGKL